MSTELTTTQEHTTVVANSTAELPALQAPLKMWAEQRLKECRDDWQELDTAVTEAKNHKWKTSTLSKAAGKALARINFYDKVVAALDAGYMLFPPVPNADVIAFRCSDDSPPNQFEETPDNNWSRPITIAEEVSPLPKGEGEYLSPVVKWIVLDRFKNDKGAERRTWAALDLEAADFPLLMGKPSIIRAVNAAMELRVFDEIRMFPFERRPVGDPCLLGTVVEKGTRRKHYFLISWRIDRKDI